MKLESLPRHSLATLPTPLEDLPRLSEELGVRVLVKRDDLTGFALGGNKARKLEFLIADALEHNADIVVTGGGPQSNHARMTAAAARRAGLDAALVLFGNPPAETNGNLLLDELLGADLVYTHTNDRSQTDRIIERVVEDLRASGRRPYLIPRGGSTPLGCVSYILAFREVMAQLSSASGERIVPDFVFVATGSCGTHAGILAGLKLMDVKVPVHGVTVSRPKAECVTRIGELVRGTAEFIETRMAVTADEIIIHDEYIGEGYGIITAGARDAIRRVAQLEGIFLDPVYTGKAMAGLIDLVERGEIPREATVLFWHTGGAPGLFGYPKSFAAV